MHGNAFLGFASGTHLRRAAIRRIATSRSRSRRAAHRRFTRTDFLYQSDTDSYRCPAGKTLQRRTREVVAGRRGTRYEASGPTAVRAISPPAV